MDRHEYLDVINMGTGWCTMVLQYCVQQTCCGDRPCEKFKIDNQTRWRHEGDQQEHKES